jgi:hypothetical protein
MIINQTITNGFSVINKTGAYFSLISAGGVVRVKLTYQGSTALDTKMWVGMSIDKPIPFDEITIYGDDGALEFWAGDVSMFNSRYANSAANALRTSVNLVSGSKVIAGADLTRTAVRVRSDKEVFVHGAGLQLGGWRVPANEVVEIPLAGVISAYKRAAFLDYSAPSAVEQDDLFFEAGAFNFSPAFVSDDDQFRMCCNSLTGGTLRYTTDGGATWNSGPSSVYNYECDTRTGIHYALQLKGSSGYGQTVVFLRSYDGIEWETMYRRYHSWAVGAGTGRAIYRAALVNGWFQCVFYGMAICCDIETGQVVITPLTVNGTNVQQGAWLDESLKVGIFGPSNELFKTEDGGITWRSVLPNYYNATFSPASDGVHLFASANARPHVSEDGGETWTQVGDSSWSQARGTHVFGNLWLGHFSRYIRYVDMPNGVGSETGGGLVYTSALDIKSVFIKPNGEIYTGPAGRTTVKTSISVVGDLSSARVEVMELLS